MVRSETWEQRQQRLKKEYEEYLSGKWHYQYAFKITCSYCNNDFYASNRRQKYCCYRCTNDAYIKRRKDRKALEKQKVCVMCGKVFEAKKKDAIYCSNACKQKAYRKKSVTDYGFGKIAITEISNT